MNGFADEVLARIEDKSCLADDIVKGRCGVSLVDAPGPRLIIDLDEPGSPLGRSKSKCDYLFFADPNLVVPIEIKSAEPKVAKVAEQLRAGAQAADELASKGIAVVCSPVLVSRDLRRKARIDLRKARVPFRGREERIRRVACGDLLTDALGDI